TAPGTSELTRMFCEPSSRASVRVRPWIAAFAAVYAAMPGVHPRHSAQVADRSAALTHHPGRNRLRGEEVVAKIDREPIVPVLRRHVLDRVPVVAGRVVERHRAR